MIVTKDDLDAVQAEIDDQHMVCALQANLPPNVIGWPNCLAPLWECWERRFLPMILGPCPKPNNYREAMDGLHHVQQRLDKLAGNSDEPPAGQTATPALGNGQGRTAEEQPPVEAKEPRADGIGEQKAIAGIVFRPGGFSYRTATVQLKGKPLLVLRSFAEARDRIRTARDLYELLYPNDVDGREESTIRTHVSKARGALCEAIRLAKVDFAANPLPCIDRGTGALAWQLAELP